MGYPVEQSTGRIRKQNAFSQREHRKEHCANSALSFEWEHPTFSQDQDALRGDFNMPQTPNSTPTVDVAPIIEPDLAQHIDYRPTVNAIRDGKLIEVSWNDLTEDERRAAYVVMFNPCRW